MAFYRTGVPRRENSLGGSMGTSSTSVRPLFDEFGDIESNSLFSRNRKEQNNQYEDQIYNTKKGIVIKRWGNPDGQQFEQAVKIAPGSDDDEATLRELYGNSMDDTGTTVPPVPDRECCSWLQISAPNTVQSGSTSGVSAGNKTGCVYYWSIEGCNPSYWGCGTLTAAGTGGSGAGLHQTSKGMVFIAPTIPDAKDLNCGRTVDTKIKVAVLTADGKKQVAAAVGTDGWHGYGMGPGDELYDLFGPDNVCDETATITTVADDCNDGDCANVHIGYASKTMGVNEYQGLIAVGATSDMDIRWENTGGGSISGSGVNVVYGSPPSNWNCEENGYIKLYCNNQLVDSLKISTTVFIYTWVAEAVGKNICNHDIPAGEPTDLECEPVSNGVAYPSGLCANGFCYGKCCTSYYLCDGSLYSRGFGAASWSWNLQPEWCEYPHPTNCYLHGGDYWEDLRTQEMKDVACCPPDL